MRALIIALVFLYILMQDSFAQSISISPDKLQFRVSGKEDQKQLIVYNGNRDAMNFTIRADKFQKWFEFSKENFELKPNELKAVKISVNPDEANGEYLSSIIVSSSGNGDNVEVLIGASAKARIIVERSPDAFFGVFVAGSIVASGLLIYLQLKT